MKTKSPLCEADERFAIAIGAKTEAANTARLSQTAYEMSEQIVGTASSKLSGSLATVAGVIDNATKAVQSQIIQTSNSQGFTRDSDGYVVAKSLQTSSVQANKSHGFTRDSDGYVVATNGQIDTNFGYKAPGKKLLLAAGYYMC